MKFILVILLAFPFYWNADAKDADSTRAELISLMKERKILADEYYASLDKKSGFFGNRTKNDLRDSQEKLVAIVKADNKIMDALNRTLSFRNYEKANMTYDVNSYEERIRNLSRLNDTLNKQILIYSEENMMNRKVIKRNQIYFFGLIFLILLMSFSFIKKNFLKK
jgi:hypothetical protein